MAPSRRNIGGMGEQTGAASVPTVAELTGVLAEDPLVTDIRRRWEAWTAEGEQLLGDLVRAVREATARSLP